MLRPHAYGPQVPVRTRRVTTVVTQDSVSEGCRDGVSLEVVSDVIISVDLVIL